MQPYPYLVPTKFRIDTSKCYIASQSAIESRTKSFDSSCVGQNLIRLLSTYIFFENFDWSEIKTLISNKVIEANAKNFVSYFESV